MLCNRIILFFYIISLIIYNTIGKYLTIQKKKKKNLKHKNKSHQPKLEF